MSDRNTIDWYDEVAATYSAGRRPPGHYLNAFMALLPPGGSVLDLGCGGGPATAVLADAGFAAIGLDASAGLLQIARQTAPDARFIEADFSALDDVVAPASLDGVYANFALVHVARADMPAHLARIARALRSGAAFHLAMMLGEGEGRDRLGRFYAYYAVDELRELLAEAGLILLSESQTESTSAAGDPVHLIVLLSLVP